MGDPNGKNRSSLGHRWCRESCLAGCSRLPAQPCAICMNGKMLKEVSMGEQGEETAPVRVMNALFRSGELTITSDRRMVLRARVVTENNQSSSFIELSEAL